MGEPHKIIACHLFIFLQNLTFTILKALFPQQTFQLIVPIVSVLKDVRFRIQLGILLEMLLLISNKTSSELLKATFERDPVN